MGVKIEGKKHKLIILTVYRKPGFTEAKGTWEKLLSDFKGQKVIMMGDFNAHNIIWNCNKTDKNGTMSLEEYDEERLYIVNSDTKSRFGEGGMQDSNLDLLFCSGSMLHRFTHSQINDTWGSDHYPISFSIDDELQPYENKSNRISNGKTDWGKYEEILKENQDELQEMKQTGRNHIEMYDILYKVMIKAAAESTGKRYENILEGKEKKSKYVSKKKNPAEWWDVECQRAVDERKEKLVQFKKNFQMTDYINYKKAKAEAIKIINKKKKRQF